MKKIPKISDAEWLVMKVVWQKSPITAKEIIDFLSPTTEWKPKTIMTLLNRLVKKSALDFEKISRTYHFFPLIQEEECIKEESQSFITKIYNGSVKPMLVNFIQDSHLSKKDIEELKKILEDRGKSK